MKGKIILYRIGIVVIAIAVGLIWLSFGFVKNSPTCGGIPVFVMMFGVAWVGGKGWDTMNPFIKRYKPGLVFLVVCIPILDLVVPYWAGLGIARLTGLAEMLDVG